MSLTLKVYDQNFMSKYRLYLLLGVIIFYLIDYIYDIYIYSQFFFTIYIIYIYIYICLQNLNKKESRGIEVDCYGDDCHSLSQQQNDKYCSVDDQFAMVTGAVKVCVIHTPHTG